MGEGRMRAVAAGDLAGVRAAEAALRAVFEPTPLQRNDFLSAKYAADVWLKREDLSPVRSYKIRGAFNAMRKALAARPDRRRFVCASAGNHAQGVAYACRHFAAEGVVFMPVTTPQQKIDKTRQFGGGRVEIRLVGDYFDETLRAAQAFTAASGRALPAAVRRRRRDRGPGDLRAGDPPGAAGAGCHRGAGGRRRAFGGAGGRGRRAWRPTPRCGSWSPRARRACAGRWRRARS